MHCASCYSLGTIDIFQEDGDYIRTEIIQCPECNGSGIVFIDDFEKYDELVLSSSQDDNKNDDIPF